MTQKNLFYLTVEGNIGAGKSTFLSILRDQLNLDIIYEPTDKWQKSKSGNILDLFYKDTKRWAYTFQSYAFITRIQSQVEHQKLVRSNDIQVYERSVYCDRYCFAKNCHALGLMTDMEWHIYKEWFEWLVETFTTSPRGIIYLKTTPEVCFKRANDRNRNEEENISLDYLRTLHNRHEEWLVEKKEILPSLQDTPVLTLDCNRDFENDLVYQEELLSKVASFIEQIEAQKAVKLGSVDLTIKNNTPYL